MEALSRFLSILLLSLMSCGHVQAGEFQDDVIKTAASLSYIHRGMPEVAKILAYQGLPPDISFCLAGAVWCYHVTADKYHVKLPIPKMARVSLFWKTCKGDDWKYEIIKSDDISWGKKIQRADIGCISEKASGTNSNWNGHAFLVESPRTASSVNTWEFNTTVSTKGNQREGGHVAHRIRYVGAWSFHLEGFVRPRRIS